MTKSMEGNRLGIPSLDDFITPVSGEAKTHSNDELKKYIEDHAYQDGMEVPKDEAVLFYNDILIGSRGNIITIHGKAKSRKSAIAAAMQSAVYSGGFLGFTSALNKTNARILHVDTEQGLGHWIKGNKRVMHDAGIQYKPNGYLSFHCRDATASLRLDLVGYAVEMHRPDILITDGITDLMYDTNSTELAARLVETLMQWSVKYNCLIIVIIHVTKGAGWMRGALGTALEGKCQTAIKAEKDEENEEVSHISCEFARDEGFKTFSIQFDKKAEHYVHVDESLVIRKGKKGDLGPKGFNEAIQESFLEAVFRGPETSFDERGFKNKLQRVSAAVLGQSVNAKHIKEWREFWQEQAKIFYHEQYGYVLTSTLTQLKKQAPEIDFSAPHDEPLLPENIVDDLPF
jgi:hypothetical protein